MKKYFKTIFPVITILFVSSIVISSCKKINLAPVIIISQPTDGSMLVLLDTIHIQGTVTDDKGLHEMSVVLVKGTSDTVYAKYPYVHDLKTYSFQYYFHPTASGTYTLQVNTTDHDEAKSEKIVSEVVM